MAVFSPSNFVQTIPLGTRILTALLLSFSISLLLLRLTTTIDGIHLKFSRQDSALEFPWLVIVPGSSWKYPWTLLTAAFCETSFIEFLVSLFALPLAGRYLERQWGAIELFKFSAIVIVGSNLIAWGLALLLFAVLRKESLIYATQYHGLEALQVAFLVALTQVIPEHQVQLLKGAVKLRVKDLPMLYVTFSNVACIIGFTSPFILIQFGWLLSWAYLRFFQVKEGGLQGDRSEAFAFVNWFPPLAHKPVTFISEKLFDFFVKLRIIKPWGPGGSYSDLEMGNSNLPVPPGGARAEAERRRAMALKALDQRLAGSGTTANGGGSGTKASRPGMGNSPTSAHKGEEKKSHTGATTTTNSEKVNGSAIQVPAVVFQAPEEDDEGGDIGTEKRSS
ncbi:DUF1751-domain-containing protein [Violaceomyces palustris]|uniref:DUF1751-domain-containing protein n=1 Tax=Violaceomyces palustris TaxID=1673888 RepID=A0ACD0NUR9_9BASI|nr:DUF1751-domain-containing protein [Violaceomyces palustris]